MTHLSTVLLNIKRQQPNLLIKILSVYINGPVIGELRLMQQKLSPCYFLGKKMANSPPLFFNGTMLENSKSHKHIGVTFNSNGKWNNHINEIYTKACRRINILRLMKYKLYRKSLEKLYIGFIRPILEYGEQFGIIVQLEAARKITGLTMEETPLYLLNYILLHSNHQSSYNLRFNRVFEPPLCNTTQLNLESRQHFLFRLYFAFN